MPRKSNTATTTREPWRRGEPLWTVEDVAEFLRAKPRYVWQLAREGRLPAIRIGSRYYRFRRQDIEAWAAGEADGGLVEIGGRR